MPDYTAIKPQHSTGTTPPQGDIVVPHLPTRQEAKTAPDPTEAQSRTYDRMWGRGHDLAKLGESIKPEVAQRWVQSDLADFRAIQANEGLTRSTLLYMHDWGQDCPPYQAAMEKAAPRLAQSVQDMKSQDRTEAAAAKAAAGAKAGAAATGGAKMGM